MLRNKSQKQCCRFCFKKIAAAVANKNSTVAKIRDRPFFSES
jgi:hypothetical protein